nr:hypothetical protein LTR18_006922 [Exophiala xenobiotica]
MACTDPSRFMFVEYKEPTIPAQGQKRRRGGPSEVRAHITKEFHRKLRVKRLDSLRPQTTLTDRSKLVRPVAHHDEEIQTATLPRTSTMPASPKSLAGFPDEDTSVQVNLSPGLKNGLGEDRTDPFNALPVNQMSKYSHMVLDHQLPGDSDLVAEHSSRKIESIESGQKRMAQMGREIVKSAPVMRLHHKIEAIKLVNEQLRHLTGPPTDALIMSVAILAIHDSYDEIVHPKIHPTSPLATAQNLHVYGNMVNEEQHLQAIILLIMQKGGLESLELFGMADIMALWVNGAVDREHFADISTRCDLYFSTKYVRRPVFPLLRPPQSLVMSGKHQLDSVAIELDSELGSGFRYFRATPSGRKVLEILDSWVEVTTALDHFARKGPTAPELVDLIEARGASQHRLLSQMSDPLEVTDPDGCIHQATRLATLIFGDMAIFPLPPTQGVKPRLAAMLMEVLQTCGQSRCWDLHAQVLIWALTLGAIAASFTPTRVWYVDQLKHRASELQITDGIALASICSRHLWWKPVCSKPTEKLWLEIRPPVVKAQDSG